jgi:hypothetical protein
MAIAVVNNRPIPHRIVPAIAVLRFEFLVIPSIPRTNPVMVNGRLSRGKNHVPRLIIPRTNDVVDFHEPGCCVFIK